MRLPITSGELRVLKVIARRLYYDSSSKNPVDLLGRLGCDAARDLADKLALASLAADDGSVVMLDVS